MLGGVGLERDDPPPLPEPPDLNSPLEGTPAVSKLWVAVTKTSQDVEAETKLNRRRPEKREAVEEISDKEVAK